MVETADRPIVQQHVIPFDANLPQRLLDAEENITDDRRDFAIDSLSRGYICIAGGLKAGQIVSLEPPEPSGNFPLPLGDRSVIAYNEPGERGTVKYRVFEGQLPRLLATVFSGETEEYATAFEALQRGSTLVFEPFPAMRPDSVKPSY